MTRRVVVAAVLFGVFIALGNAAPAVAQQYPPPASVGDSCFVVRGLVNDRWVVGRAEYRSAIQVEGSEGCAAPNGKVDISAGGVDLGSITANEDGSFLGTLDLPSSVKPGSRSVTGDIEGRGRLNRALEVIGAAVLGSSDTRPAGAAPATDADGGVLPRTGGDLFLFVLWALVLIVLGTLLAKAAQRHRARVAYANARSMRAGVPRGPVPFIDTSRFVPRQVSREARRADAERGARLAEWDRPQNEPPA